MSGPQLEIVVALPFVLLGVALVAAFAWAPETPGLARARATRGVADRIRGLVQLVGAWLVLTTLTVWCVALVAFLVRAIVVDARLRRAERSAEIEASHHSRRRAA